MVTIKDINLRYNPFQYLSSTRGSTSLVWAGMKKQKKTIENIYMESFRQDSKKIILNWGPWGGGKTHAAHYFEKNTVEGLSQEKIIHIYVNTTKGLGKGAVEDFVKRVIKDIKVKPLRKIITDTVQKIGKEQLENLISQRVDEVIAKTILSFTNTLYTDELILRYMLGGLSKPQLEKTHIIQNLKTEQDYIDFLAGLIVTFTADSDIRVFIWIDEMEDMLAYGSREFKLFSSMLRDFTEKISEKVIIIMNLSLAGHDEELVKNLMGSALWRRITDTIRFYEFNELEAVEYLTELTNYAKIDKDLQKPFSAEVIKYVINNIPTALRLPSEINGHMHTILSYALDNGITNIKVENVKKALEQKEN